MLLAKPDHLADSTATRPKSKSQVSFGAVIQVGAISTQGSTIYLIFFTFTLCNDQVSIICDSTWPSRALFQN